MSHDKCDADMAGECIYKNGKQEGRNTDILAISVPKGESSVRYHSLGHKKLLKTNSKL